MDAAVVRLVRMALNVITDRLLSIFALLMTFGLAMWTMHNPTWERMGMAGFFALFVYIPALLKEKGNSHEAAEKGPE